MTTVVVIIMSPLSSCALGVGFCGFIMCFAPVCELDDIMKDGERVGMMRQSPSLLLFSHTKYDFRTRKSDNYDFDSSEL